MRKLASLGHRANTKGERRRTVAGDADAFGQAVTFASGPTLFGLLGSLVDAKLDAAPLFTVMGIIVGCAGGAATLWYRYQARMETLEADKPWRRMAHRAVDVVQSNDVVGRTDHEMRSA